MSENLFASSDSKVKRAYRHIQELESRVTAFILSKDHRVVSQPNAVTGRSEIRLKSSKGVPIIVNLLLGDAIHNLRSALDHAMTSIVNVLIPNSSLNHIYFPIRDDRTGAEAALGEGVIGQAMSVPIGIALKQVILNEIKPYGGRDSAIRSLNKLDNIDKHRMILTILGLADINPNSITIGRPDDPIVTLKNCHFRMKLGAQQGIVNGPSAKIKGNTKPAVQVFIHEAELAPDQPLIPRIKEIAHFVSEAIKKLDRAYRETAIHVPFEPHL